MGAERLYRGYMGFIWENRGEIGVMWRLYGVYAGVISGLYRGYGTAKSSTFLLMITRTPKGDFFLVLTMPDA